MSKMNVLDDLVAEILLHCTANELTNMSVVNKRSKELISTNWFWKLKFIRDYGTLDCNEIVNDWRFKYFNHRNIYVMGKNSYGELGIHGEKTILCPTLLKDIIAKQIENSSEDTMVLDIDGNVWVMGLNLSGKLGLSDQTHIREPVMLQNIKAKFISSKYNQSMIIDHNDDLWVIGCGIHSENRKFSKHTPFSRVNYPCLIPNIKAKFVAVGISHSIIIDLENNVWCLGDNQNGQLGLGQLEYAAVPTLLPNIKAKYATCGGYCSLIIDLDDNLLCMGQNLHFQLGIPEHEVIVPTIVPDIKARKVDASGGSTMVIDIFNNVWVAGQNGYGNLGVGENLKIVVRFKRIENIKAKTMSTSLYHSCIVDMGGNLYIMGANSSTHAVSNDDIYHPTLIPNISALDVTCSGPNTFIITK